MCDSVIDRISSTLDATNEKNLSFKPVKKNYQKRKSIIKDIPAAHEYKVTNPEKVVANIKSGDHIFLGSACAAPRTTYQAIENTAKQLEDVQILHFLSDNAIPLKDEIADTKFQHKVFFVGSVTEGLINKGKAQYIPISIVQLPKLIENGRIPIDVAIIQTSLPDEYGFVSLGVSVDITKTAAENADMVIAEINPHMPRTLGDSFIHIDKIDHMVFVNPDPPVTEYLHPSVDDVVANQIARYVATLIDHGSTLQIGLGRVQNQMLKYLDNRRDLGIHSDVITEPIADLIEKGIITGNAKQHHKGKIVTSYCMGTKRLYDLIDRNPMFSFHPIDYVCDPELISRNNKMVSFTQAFAIDLTGQVCTDQREGNLYGGVSTQPEFIRGAANSPGGKPITCLSSTYITHDGTKSAIRPLLKEGEGITIPRSDVHYVVTEYGIAYLFCKSIQDRALALIEIAHPDYRPWLLEEAKRLGYVRRNQILRSKVSYPAEEERLVQLKNGSRILLRPAKASDVKGLQDIFYDLTPEDIRTRFFERRASLSISQAELFCNVDYETQMAFIAEIGDREKAFIIGSSCYVVDQTTNMAEVAYMIRPAWQGLGLGTFLQKRMIEYASSKGVRGFLVDILEENIKMRRLAESFSNVSTSTSNDIVEVTMLF